MLRGEEAASGDGRTHTGPATRGQATRLRSALARRTHRPGAAVSRRARGTGGPGDTLWGEASAAR